MEEDNDRPEKMQKERRVRVIGDAQQGEHWTHVANGSRRRGPDEGPRRIQLEQTLTKKARVVLSPKRGWIGQQHVVCAYMMRQPISVKNGAQGLKETQGTGGRDSMIRVFPKKYAPIVV